MIYAVSALPWVASTVVSLAFTLADEPAARNVQLGFGSAGSGLVAVAAVAVWRAPGVAPADGGPR